MASGASQLLRSITDCVGLLYTHLGMQLELNAHSGMLRRAHLQPPDIDVPLSNSIAHHHDVATCPAVLLSSAAMLEL